MAVTLQQLRTLVRQRADMPARADGDGVVTDAELSGYINFAGARLHDLLVQTHEDYFAALSPEFTLTSVEGGNVYDLPADFLKLRKVERDEGGEWYALDPFNLNEWDRRVPMFSRRGFQRVRYGILGNKLVVHPADRAAGTYRIWYTVGYSDLTADGDRLSIPLALQRFYDWIVIDATIRCLLKEESDVSILLGMRAELEQAIRVAAAGRDEGRPARVAEVDEHDDYDRWFA